MSEETIVEQGHSCAVCEHELVDTYHLANDAMVCSGCRAQLGSTEPTGSGLSRFTKAVAFGLIGGAIGAAIYFGILEWTGYEVGLVAIAVGFLVGAGVRLGTGGHGGWLYQTLAVGITYSAIVTTYIPFIVAELNDGFVEDAVSLSEEVEVPKVHIRADDSVWLDGRQVSTAELRSDLERVSEATPAVWYHREGMDDSDPPPVAEEVADAIDELGLERWTFRDAAFTEPMTVMDGMSGGGPLFQLAGAAFLFFVAATSPFLALPENLIGLAIIGFALYQAWSMNRREKLELEGPFELSRAPTESHIEP